MPSVVVLAWLLGMLVAVMVAAWLEKRRRTMSLGVVIDGRMEEHPPRLVTIDALEEGIGHLRRGVLVEVGVRPVESSQRSCARAVGRRARGPPWAPRSIVDDVHERESPDRKEKTC
jgi:hypothetical protein